MVNCLSMKTYVQNPEYRNCPENIFTRLCWELIIGVAPITHLRTCLIKIETFNEGHLMW